MDNIKKMPTYTKVTDLPENLQKELKERGVIQISPSFDTKYMLTYGTLRWGHGNWDWCFKNRTKHLATLVMKGFLKGQGLSCQYTGNPEHETTMDLFEINGDIDSKNFAEVNADTDSLEGVHWTGKGGYESTAVPIELEGNTVLAKFYNVELTNHAQYLPKNDYALTRYRTWEENKKDGGKNTAPAMAMIEKMQNEAPSAWAHYLELGVFSEEIEENTSEITETITNEYL